jgi:UDP-N-acetylglucosamine--N-acetylmuramyl-(pentapeptide) pyrophosphoryl-undecaprenol N-acetylglucosamine transferase
MTQTPLNIVFAVGGTGGHLFPAIAIAQEFMARNCENRIIFLGTGKPIEISVLSEYGFASRKISAEGIKGRGLFRQAGAMLTMVRGVFQSIGILKSEKPDLVVGMGSYSSAPVVLAAWLSRIPVVLCEQNVLPGIANRYLSRIADRVCVSFKDTMGNLPKSKIRFTGNPVRIEILQAERKKKDMEEPFTVLILGGSQGAHAINMAVIEAIKTLKKSETFSSFIRPVIPMKILLGQPMRKTGCPVKSERFLKIWREFMQGLIWWYAGPGPQQLPKYRH